MGNSVDMFVWYIILIIMIIEHNVTKGVHHGNMSNVQGVVLHVNKF